MVNAFKRELIGKKMSSSRLLDKLLQAGERLLSNKADTIAADAVNGACAASRAAASVQTEQQVIDDGSDLAFAI